MVLSECIADRILKDGPIPFHKFMEWCLYDPELGYYTSKNNPIGIQGDFYTSPILSPVFGNLVGKQLEEMWVLMDFIPFTIVEIGAGPGHLCRDIMNYLETSPKMYTEMRYCIIEKSPLMRQQALKQLNDKVEWYSSISEINDITGCILSNELVDNFPVHRVVMKQELMEVYVDYQNGFAEVLEPAGPKLKNYLDELDICLPRGYATEINLEALEWMKEISSALKNGYVMTIDYGYSNPNIYSASRGQGTMVCYYNHTVNDSFYEHIGEQDITSHVNFSALSHWGTKYGLRESGITNQGYFLSSLGFRDQLMKTLSGESDVVRAAQKAASLSHTLLIDMGSKYKVLIQQKGLQAHKLSGLRL